MTTNLWSSLKSALLANSIFSVISAIILLLFASSLAPLFALNSGLILQIVGIILLLNALNLLFGVINDEKRELIGKFAIFGDLSWVIGSIVILIAFPSISTIGVWLIIIIGIIVLDFALWQLNAIINPTGLIRKSRVVSVPADVAWSIVSDVDGYYKYAPNISKIKIVEGDGKDMIRQCWDQNGNTWTERCTTWEQGNQYTFDVDVSEFHLPMNKFQGTFGVIPIDSNSTEIFMQFEYSLKYGLLGWIMTKLSSGRNNQLVEKTLDNWERDILSTAEIKAKIN